MIAKVRYLPLRRADEKGDAKRVGTVVLALGAAAYLAIFAALLWRLVA